jgi:DNA adenine methylase
MRTFSSPLRYPGGKNCIYEFVSNLIKDNGFKGFSYAEPYAGGAGLALRLLFEDIVSDIYVNDLDRFVFAFWITVTENSELFCEWIDSIEITMDNWHYYKNIQRNNSETNQFELAKTLFFLNRTNISGVIKGGVIGGLNQTGQYKIDARFNKVDLIKRIAKIAKYKDRVHISNLDGLAFIEMIDQKEENIFVYLDPPYFQKGSELYMNYYSKSDHERLAEYAMNMKKNWMISYDNHEFILNLYTTKEKCVYKLSQGTSNRVGEELLIFSDCIHDLKSIQYLKDPVFINANPIFTY